MPIVIDTTVLSNLAAVNRLDLLRLLGNALYLVSAVYEEIQHGLEQGYTFLTNVDHALDAGLLQLVTIEGETEWQRFRSMPNKLHRGEAMSLTIAVERGWLFLTDDRAARIHAGRQGLSYSGTLGLLRYAVQNEHITLEEGNSLLAGMISLVNYNAPVTDLRDLLAGG
ncbi:MAG: hypothetical protein KDJ52_23545 [Anaerolineae bacterium]|nr:hypothetical protein [Anaerolineae bacterium]